MKKLVLLLTVLMLCFGCASALAVTATDDVVIELEPFDHTVLKNLAGYEYDKFDKTWDYYGAYVKEYSDAVVVIGIKAYNHSDDDYLLCEIYCWIRDENNRTVIDSVESLQILADDTLIDCSMLVGDTASSTMFTPTSEEALKYIGEAKSLMFKLNGKYTSTTLEPTAFEVRELQTAAKNIYKYHLPQYSDPSFASFVEMLYPIIIE